MSLREQLTATRQGLWSIMRQHNGPSRSELIRRYLGSQARLGSRRGPPAPNTSRLFNFDVSYFSEEAYLILLGEIFIERHYHVALTNPAPRIVDGGANIGMSVLLWKHLYPNASVLAFEPDPDTFSMLKRNVEQNGLKDVELVNAALSDKEGELTFFYNAGTPGNLGMTTAEGSTLRDVRKVKAELLSTRMDGPVDLLKLDVEGSEHDVLADLAGTGKLALVDQIVMEYHHHMKPDEDRLGAFLSVLEERGFGYQIAARPDVPFTKSDFSAFLLYAYKKRRG
jgi:FkbM family methyltransferase